MNRSIRPPKSPKSPKSTAGDNPPAGLVAPHLVQLVDLSLLAALLQEEDHPRCALDPEVSPITGAALFLHWTKMELILKYICRDPVFGGSPYPLQYGGCGVGGLQVRLPLDSLVQGENISSQLGKIVILLSSSSQKRAKNQVSSLILYLFSPLLYHRHRHHHHHHPHRHIPSDGQLSPVARSGGPFNWPFVATAN